MLNTPLGAFKIVINGQDYDFEAIELPKIEQRFSVDGRYRIIVNLEAYKNQDTILEGVLDITVNDNINTTPETGEKLALISFWNDNFILSVGFEGDIDFPNVKYKYLNDRIQIFIPRETEVKSIPCNIAWLDMEDPEYESSYTWLAAAPV
jgi:hypothetical protein